MTAFILVPGGWHGAWVYDDVAAALRQRGHDPLPVTLTGVGERVHLSTGSTNLDAHIEDVLLLLESQQINNGVLCGHSYAGMVITGVADRAPHRVAGLIYIDAYVPQDGDSCWNLTTPAFRRMFMERASADGYSVEPPPGLDPRATQHPLASLLQRLSLSGRHERVGRRDFVFLSRWRDTPFAATYERLRNDPRWQVHTVHTGHNVMAEAPGQLAEILASHGTASDGGSSG